MGAGSLVGVHDPGASWSPGRAARAARDALAVVEGRVAGVRELPCGALHLAWVPAPGAPEPSGDPGVPGASAPVCVVDGVLDAVPAGWPAQGAAGLADLRGDAVVVLWDGATTHVARDHAGVRPLVWAQDGPRTVFASHVAQLLALLERAPAPDPGGLGAWVSAQALEVDRTLFAGVHRLPAAGVLELCAGRDPAVRRSWAPRWAPPAAVDHATAAGRAAAALTAAVARRSRGPGRTAVMLSGGLDSSTVAALGARRVPDDRRIADAYAATFPDHPAGDEADRIAAVGRALDLRVRTLEVRASGAVAGAIAYVRRWRVPPVSPNVGFWPLLLDRAAQEGVEVLLDGEGGDEVFGAPLLLLADRLAAGRLLSLRNLLRRAPSWRPGGLDARSRRRALRTIAVAHGLPPWLVARLPGFGGAPPQPWRQAGVPRWWAHQADLVLTGVAPAQGADHLARRAASSGLLARHPLRDVDLIGELLALPPDVHFSPRSRPLLRAAGAGLVPDEVRLRLDKSPFDSIFHAALEADRDLIAELLHPGRSRLGEHIDLAQRADRLLGAAAPTAPAARAGWALSLWRLVTAELWLRHLAGDDLAAAEGRAAPVRAAWGRV